MAHYRTRIVRVRWLAGRHERHVAARGPGPAHAGEPAGREGDVRRIPRQLPAHPDLDFNGAVGTQECVDDAFTTWRREIVKAERWFDSVSESDLGRMLPIARREGEEVSIRDLVVHMIEEYARHCGHADLLRECIDGRTGQ